MAAEKYNLRIDDINHEVSVFAEKNDLTLNASINDTTEVYRFMEKGVSKLFSMLTCYKNSSGVSFLFGGKNKSIAKKCKMHLIETTEFSVGVDKKIVVKPVSDEELQVACDFLCVDCECVRETVESNDPHLKDTFVIRGKYSDSIRFLHYTTGTLLVQGRPGLTFINFMSIAAELFNPSEVKKEYLKVFDIEEGSEVLSSDLSSHLPNAYPNIGKKLDAIMAPSLILLNSYSALTDYSAYAFPVLRGSEGILRKVFAAEGIIFENGFGDFFRFNRAKGECFWAKPTNDLFPDDKLRKSLLDLYRYHYKHRHTTFHMDATIETSTTLSYEQALEIVKECLARIDNIYLHLN